MPAPEYAYGPRVLECLRTQHIALSHVMPPLSRFFVVGCLRQGFLNLALPQALKRLAILTMSFGADCRFLANGTNGWALCLLDGISPPR